MHRQTPRAIERFWRVVLVSALDEELDRTDARFTHGICPDCTHEHFPEQV